MNNHYITRSNIQINYLDFLEALLIKVEERQEYIQQFPDNHNRINEFLTIGFTAPQKSGKTSTILDFIHSRNLLENRQFLFFSPRQDDNYQRGLSAKYNSKFGTKIALPILNLRSIRESINLKISDGISRKKHWEDKHGSIDNVKFIIIDDASIAINRYGFTNTEFNKWVHELFGSKVIVIKIG